MGGLYGALGNDKNYKIFSLQAWMVGICIDNIDMDP
jgi:hypothetical protein